MSLGRRVRALLEQSIEVSASTRTAMVNAGLFVLGAPRTGASDLAWALSESPGFWTGGDSNFFLALIGPDENGRSRLHEAYLRGSTAGDYRIFAEHMGRGIERLLLARSHDRHWIDAAQENVLVAADLAYLLPRARFIHLVRDGRAVVRSALLAGPKWARWAPDARAAASLWALFCRAGLELEERHPERVLRCRAEALIADPDGSTALIQAFLEVEPCDAPARFLRRRGLSSSYVDRSADESECWPAFDVPEDGDWAAWPAEDRAAFTEVAGDTMRVLGYWPATSR